MSHLARLEVIIGLSLIASTLAGAPAVADDAAPNDGAESPNVCVMSPKLPNGRSLADHSAKSGAPHLHSLQAEVALDHIKEDERRFRMTKPVSAVGGRELASAPQQRRHLVVGSLEVRSEPGGKVIDSLPDGLAVLIEGEKGDWVLVRGYWDLPCSTGWTKKVSLKPHP